MAKNDQFMHSIGIDIMVEPWMYNYLTKTLGPSPWKMTMKSCPDGKLIFANMCGKIDYMKKPEVWDKKNERVVYRMIIPLKWHHQYGKYAITPEGIDVLVEYWQQKFKRELILWVESRKTMCENNKTSLYVKQAILDFCEKYNLTEDIMPYDTMKKRVYRHFAGSKAPIVVYVQ